MRRVLMTPTFAAGLGVVIAAVMASNVNGSLLHLSGIPDKGTPCVVPGCGPDGGGLASAKPGKRLRNPHTASPSARPGGRRSTGGDSSAAQGVEVQYRTMGGGAYGSFYGYLVITSRTGQSLGNWTFQFTYPSAQITGVWAGAPVPHGAHSATVTAAQARSGWSAGQQVQIMFSVSGPAGPPVGCSFDGHACQYTVSQNSGGGQGSSGYDGGRNGQGGQGGSQQGSGGQGGGYGG